MAGGAPWVWARVTAVLLCVSLHTIIILSVLTNNLLTIERVVRSMVENATRS